MCARSSTDYYSNASPVTTRKKQSDTAVRMIGATYGMNVVWVHKIMHSRHPKKSTRYSSTVPECTRVHRCMYDTSKYEVSHHEKDGEKVYRNRADRRIFPQNSHDTAFHLAELTGQGKPKPPLLYAVVDSPGVLAVPSPRPTHVFGTSLSATQSTDCTESVPPRLKSGFLSL